ncbi:MAG TPA: HNH endonuclease signature motif containing protein, partial [Chitinophagaceae bacterium]|jgi:5-methylcytosine-specific restriction protein A|nr:HNH endonuclease signature motif containing protein [Chitinophagaceae bacterium]
MADIWSPTELDASVVTYMEMLSKELRGIPYVKAQYRQRLLSSEMKGRSAASFEFRMRNISYVLQTQGRPYIAGYKPARNVGPKAFTQIEEALRRTRFIEDQTWEPTTSFEVLQERAHRLKGAVDLKKPPKGDHSPKRAGTNVAVYYRSPMVRAWILANAKGRCEACERDAPFCLPDEEPYLEVHHMLPLAQGGPDIVENTVALCPNCHRRVHLSSDREAFSSLIFQKIRRLKAIVHDPFQHSMV